MAENFKVQKRFVICLYVLFVLATMVMFAPASYDSDTIKVKIPRLTWATDGGYWNEFYRLYCCRVSDGVILASSSGLGTNTAPTWATNTHADLNAQIYITLNDGTPAYARTLTLKPLGTNTSSFVGATNVISSFVVEMSGSNSLGKVVELWRGNPDIYWTVWKGTAASGATNALSGEEIWEPVSCEWINRSD